MILSWWAACHFPDVWPATTGTVPLLATCVGDPDNATRATCSMFQTQALPVEVEVTDGVETAVFAAPAVQTIHVLPIWGLHAESEWSWTARAADGIVQGTIVPAPLAEAVTFDVTQTGGGSSSLVDVLVPGHCAGGGTAVVLDANGRVRWYAAVGGDELEVVTFTEAGTILAMVDQDAIVELDLAGQELYRIDGLDVPIHHDVMRKDDLVYTLLAEASPADDGVTYIEDIVVAYDRIGREIWRWDEHDWLDPTEARRWNGHFWDDEFPDAVDAWHTNGLFVTDDFDVLLSLKGEAALLRITIGGATTWGLYGDGSVGNALPSSFELVADGGDPTFALQHHPVLRPDGGVTLIDNAKNRGLELALDEAAGTATFGSEWPMTGVDCNTQSSMFDLPEGGRLLTCADDRTILEMDAAGAEVGRWVLSCANGADLQRTIRGQPLDLWDGVTAAGVAVDRLD